MGFLSTRLMVFLGARPWQRAVLWRVDSPAAVLARDDLLRERVAVAATVFFVLTVVCMVADFVMLDRTLALALAAGQVVMAAACVALARYVPRFPARVGLVAFFALSLGFDLYADVAFARFGAEATSAYQHLPLIATAMIAVFPLTAAEALVLAGMWLGLELLGAADDASSVVQLIIQAVTGTIAMIAATSQLNFLVQLVERSSRDGMTGALTRQVGAELLAAQIASAQRRKAPLAVAFVDLDWFKKVNDRFGHAAGDDVLTHAAAAMTVSLRRADSVIRWGGEEFLLVLPETEATGARTVLERVAARGYAESPDGKPQTASVGIAELRADHATDADSLVKMADLRLYRAKQAGRNRIVWGDEASSEALAVASPG